MRNLFFVFTQYHLLNVINLRLNVFSSAQADLIAFSPSKAGTLTIIKRAKKLKIFDRVLVLENFYPEANKLTKVYYKSKEIIVAIKNKKKIVSFIKGYKYEGFYTYGSNMEAYIALCEISKYNKVKYAWYEEGSGTYVNSFYNQLKPWCNIALRLCNIRFPQLPQEVWLYNPQMLSIACPNSVLVKELPKLKNMYVVNKVWDYNSPPKNTGVKTVYFEQPGIDTKKQIEILGLFDRRRTAVKIHPRSCNTSLYKEYTLFGSQNLLWEIYCLNNSYLVNYIFVSKFSTACFTPKMVFGMEPVIIFTYLLYDDKNNNERFYNMLKKFIASYKNSDRIIIPKSEAELKRYIDLLHL